MKNFLRNKKELVGIFFLLLITPSYLQAQSTENMLKDRLRVVNFVGDRVRETKYQNIVLKDLPKYFAPKNYSLRGLRGNFAYSFKKLPTLVNISFLPVYGYVFDSLNINKASAKETN